MSSFKDKAQLVYDAMMVVDRQQDQVDIVRMALEAVYEKGSDDCHKFIRIMETGDDK